jgi:hypothetical protein
VEKNQEAASAAKRLGPLDSTAQWIFYRFRLLSTPDKAKKTTVVLTKPDQTLVKLRQVNLREGKLI